jgi:hypothetical protein
VHVAASLWTRNRSPAVLAQFAPSGTDGDPKEIICIPQIFVLCSIIKREADMTYEIVHDKTRIAAGDPKQWLVYYNGVLRAEASSKQSAKDFVTIEKGKGRT